MAKLKIILVALILLLTSCKPMETKVSPPTETELPMIKATETATATNTPAPIATATNVSLENIPATLTAQASGEATPGTGDATSQEKPPTEAATVEEAMKLAAPYCISSIAVDAKAQQDLYKSAEDSFFNSTAMMNFVGRHNLSSFSSTYNFYSVDPANADRRCVFVGVFTWDVAEPKIENAPYIFYQSNQVLGGGSDAWTQIKITGKP